MTWLSEEIYFISKITVLNTLKRGNEKCYRSSQRSSIKKVFLKISQISQEITIPFPRSFNVDHTWCIWSPFRWLSWSYRDVISTLSNIYNVDFCQKVVKSKIIYYFHKKAPWEVLNRVLNTSLSYSFTSNF